MKRWIVCWLSWKDFPRKKFGHDLMMKDKSVMSDFGQRIANLSPEKRALLERRLMKKEAGSASKVSEPKKTTKSKIGASQTSPPLQPVSRDGRLRPSFAQERLWFVSQLETDNPFYNIPVAVRITGPLKVNAIEKSINEIIRRHEVLRTTCSTIDGEPVQVIAPDASFALPVLDLTSLPKPEREDKAMKLATQEARRAFDLTNGPVFRATLLRLSEEDHLLLLTTHHFVADGWSMDVLYRELSTHYETFFTGRPSPLPELPIQYADFAYWQRQRLQGEVLETQLRYWKKQLAGALAVTELPADRQRPAVQTHRGSMQSFALPATLSEAIKALSRREGVTLFMTLLAAFQTLLHRYTGQDDIVVGTAVSNRNRIETEGLIGPFANNVALRTDFSGNPTFRQLLGRVREVAVGAYAHQDLPWEKLIEELHPERDPSRNQVFQMFFVLHEHSMEKNLKLPGLSLRNFRTELGTARFDLSLGVTNEKNNLSGCVEYNTDLFDRFTITRLLGHFQVLLEGVVFDAGQPISSLPLLTEAERHQVLVAWNDTQGDYPNASCLHQLFEAQVTRTPEAIATIFGDQSLTYCELNARANQLANHLRTLGVKPEVLVGLCVERSLEMVVGLLGILKAGAAFVPLDPVYPRERLTVILEDSRLPLLLTQDRLVVSFPENRIRVIRLDTDWELIARESREDLSSGARPENLAYVTYTSGSTGKPKGVMIENRSVVNVLTSFIRTYGLSAADRILQQTSISFDVFVNEIFPVLCVGGAIVIPEKDDVLDLERLTRLIAKHRVTIIGAAPSLLAALNAENHDVSTLRLILSGGEVLSYSDVDRLIKSTVVTNGYGPTETTICALSYDLDPQGLGKDATIPIGKPLMNYKVYILDKNLESMPVGCPGELCISGVGLARGYLNAPELTAESFVPNPFTPGERLYRTGDLARWLPDGNVEFLGRIDDQVKIRGIRIEPAEIEAALDEYEAVRKTVVMAREDGRGDKRLAAYVVLDHEPSPTVNELRGFLKQKLPGYMVPSTFVFLDAVPLTPSGKVDRQALPAPDLDRPKLEDRFVAPRTSLERLIAEIWQDLLGMDRVGRYDNFFDLGGHSLLSMQVVARLEKKLGLRVNPGELIFQTLAQLASSCEVQMDSVRRSESMTVAQKLRNAFKNTLFRRKNSFN
jgi:amino acid adenylation domain-containing protein